MVLYPASYRSGYSGLLALALGYSGLLVLALALALGLVLVLALVLSLVQLQLQPQRSEGGARSGSVCVSWYCVSLASLGHTNGKRKWRPC